MTSIQLYIILMPKIGTLKKKLRKLAIEEKNVKNKCID